MTDFMKGIVEEVLENPAIQKKKKNKLNMINRPNYQRQKKSERLGVKTEKVDKEKSTIATKEDSARELVDQTFAGIRLFQGTVTGRTEIVDHSLRDQHSASIDLSVSDISFTYLSPLTKIVRDSLRISQNTEEVGIISGMVFDPLLIGVVESFSSLTYEVKELDPNHRFTMVLTSRDDELKQILERVKTEYDSIRKRTVAHTVITVDAKVRRLFDVSYSEEAIGWIRGKDPIKMLQLLNEWMLVNDARSCRVSIGNQELKVTGKRQEVTTMLTELETKLNKSDS